MLHQVPERRKQTTSREHNIFTRTDPVTPPHIFMEQIQCFVLHFYIFTANITYLPHIKSHFFKIAVNLISLCLLLLYSTVSWGLLDAIAHKEYEVYTIYYSQIRMENFNLIFCNTGLWILNWRRSCRIPYKVFCM